MKNLTGIVHPDPEILGGTSVFFGTRVPLRNPINYLEDDYNIEEVLEQFPFVRREQVTAVLEAIEAAVPGARPAMTLRRGVERLGRLGTG